MDKNYQKPSMKVIKIQHNASILQDSVTRVYTNLDPIDEITLGGGSNSNARVRDCSVWDQEW